MVGTKNKRKGVESIECRLDRYLANTQWLDLYPSSMVYHLPPTTSDHLTIQLKLNNLIHHQKRLFRFKNIWARHPNCLIYLDIHWKAGANDAIINKLATLRPIFLEFEKMNFGCIDLEIKKIQKSHRSIYGFTPIPISTRISRRSPVRPTPLAPR